MTKEKAREHLSRVFTTIQAPEVERIVYADAYIHAKEGTEEYEIYSAISDASHDSGHGFAFSYSVAERAVWAIIEAIDNAEDGDTLENVLESDNLHEAVSANLPYMNAELAEIVADVHSWDVVEEAMATANGSDDYTLASVLTYAWQQSIDSMARAILTNLAKV
jgi:hypothetical protein